MGEVRGGNKEALIFGKMEREEEVESARRGNETGAELLIALLKDKVNSRVASSLLLNGSL
jgi:predicted ATPase